jgi:hypothetical protein
MMTQIGGGIWLAAHIFVGRLPFCRPRPLHRLVLGFGLAIPLYLLATFIVAPPIAGSLGRTRLPCMASAGEPIMPASPLTCLLNRGYLRPEVRELIEELGTDVAHRFPGSRLTTLEAGFPFIDDFPMPPHLSHRDGLKVDIAFFYQDRQTGAAIAGGSPSPLGYFHYEHPRPGETVSCAGRWTPLRWDFAWFQLETPAWVIDENRTAAVLDWLKNDPRVTRIFIEPYLARRLKEDGGKVRFQGCLAARHDDHIHIEVKNTTR